MNICIYKNRELTVEQYLEYKLDQERPEIFCNNGNELVFVSKAVNNRKAHFRYKALPEWYISKYGNTGESEKHLIIKEHLYKLLKAQNYKPELEYSVGNLRADIAEPGRKMVYEIVTSPITNKEVIEKTLKYKELGFITFWYFHNYPNKFQYLIEELKGYFFILDFSADRAIYKKFYNNKNFITQ